MTPELEGELNKIGWAWVKMVDPWRARRLESAISATGGLLFDGPPAAKVGLNDTRLLRALLDMAQQELRSLDVGRVEAIERSAALFAGNPETPQPLVQRATEAIDALTPGLEALERLAQREAQEGLPHRPTNLSLHAIAQAVAEVFVIGTGNDPTASSPADKTDGVNGDFGKALDRIFRLLGFKPSKNYAVKAVEHLEMGDTLERPKAIRTGKHLVKVSLVTGQISGFKPHDLG